MQDPSKKLKEFMSRPLKRNLDRFEAEDQSFEVSDLQMPDSSNEFVRKFMIEHGRRLYDSFEKIAK